MMLIRILEHVNVGMGIALNLLLIFIIRRFTRAELGTYRYLLAIFAAYDLFLSILHDVVNPKAIREGSMYGSVAQSFVESAHLISAYYAFFTISFYLLNIHFLYRYWTIKHPTRVEYFTKPKFIFLIGLYLAGTYACWYTHLTHPSNYVINCMHFFAITIAAEPNDPALPVLRTAFKDIYNATATDGWIFMDCWRDGHFNYRTLTVLLPSSVIMCGQFSAAVYFGRGACRGIARAQTISHAHRSFQLKILKAVCVQTIVPVLFVYAPYSCAIFFPLLGIPDYGISYAFPILVSFFPAWDAIVIIALIKDYREGLLRLLGLKMKTTEVKRVVVVSAFSVTSRADPSAS